MNLLTKSLVPGYLDDEIDRGGNTCSEYSYNNILRLIQQDSKNHHDKTDIRGFVVTDFGIKIIWE
jgi:hypothetical protein